MKRVLWIVGLLGLLGCGSESVPEERGDGADTGDGDGDGDAQGDGDGDSQPSGDGDAEPSGDGDSGDGDSGDGDSGDGDGDGDDSQPGDGDGDEPLDGAGAPAGDGDVEPGDGDGDPTFPGPLSECPDGRSIDRLQSWLASGEGTTVPATGSILVAEGDDSVARIEFQNAEWHVVPVLTANRFEAEVDLGSSRGFWLTYSATDRFYVQLRPGFAWDGGAKYLTEIPATGGDVETRFFSFAPAEWTTLSALGTPPYPYEQALSAVRGFVFVGETPNLIAFHGLRVDGYEPPCL